MTRPSRQEVELANQIAGIVFDEIKRVWPDLHPLLDLRYGIADRVIALPLLNRVRAEAWFAGYDKGNLDGYFGTNKERVNSPYAEFDPYREQNSEGNET